jgi:hypothetical protein
MALEVVLRQISPPLQAHQPLHSPKLQFSDILPFNHAINTVAYPGPAVLSFAPGHQAASPIQKAGGPRPPFFYDGPFSLMPSARQQAGPQAVSAACRPSKSRHHHQLSECRQPSASCKRSAMAGRRHLPLPGYRQRIPEGHLLRVQCRRRFHGGIGSNHRRLQCWLVGLRP